MNRATICNSASPPFIEILLMLYQYRHKRTFDKARPSLLRSSGCAGTVYYAPCGQQHDISHGQLGTVCTYMSEGQSHRQKKTHCYPTRVGLCIHVGMTAPAEITRALLLVPLHEYSRLLWSTLLCSQSLQSHSRSQYNGPVKRFFLLCQ